MKRIQTFSHLSISRAKLVPVEPKWLCIPILYHSPLYSILVMARRLFLVYLCNVNYHRTDPYLPSYVTVSLMVSLCESLRQMTAQPVREPLIELTNTSWNEFGLLEGSHATGTAHLFYPAAFFGFLLTSSREELSPTPSLLQYLKS